MDILSIVIWIQKGRITNEIKHMKNILLFIISQLIYRFLRTDNRDPVGFLPACSRAGGRRIVPVFL